MVPTGFCLNGFVGEAGTSVVVFCQGLLGFLTPRIPGVTRQMVPCELPVPMSCFLGRVSVGEQCRSCENLVDDIGLMIISLCPSLRLRGLAETAKDSHIRWTGQNGCRSIAVPIATAQRGQGTKIVAGPTFFSAGEDLHCPRSVVVTWECWHVDMLERPGCGWAVALRAADCVWRFARFVACPGRLCLSLGRPGHGLVCGGG
jgi:hypothetical protein